MITQTEAGLLVKTDTTIMESAGGRIISIQDAITGEEFLDRGSGEGVPGFDLFHQNGKISPLGVHPLASQVKNTLLTSHIAEITLNDWECDVSLRVSEDQPTGDILIEPSAWTMQGGVYGIGLNVPAIRSDLDVIGPFQPEEPYELQGYYPGICFPCGKAVIGSTLFVYYGGADKYVGLATCRLAEMLEYLLSCPV